MSTEVCDDAAISLIIRPFINPLPFAETGPGHTSAKKKKFLLFVYMFLCSWLSAGFGFLHRQEVSYKLKSERITKIGG